MQSESADLKSPSNRVFLWSVPRSLSTILLKCLSNIPNINLQVINEPYVAAHYYGPDKKSSNNSVEDKFENVFQQAGKAVTCSNAYDDSLGTYQWVKELLEGEFIGKDMVLCKDQGYCLDRLYHMLPKGYKHTFLIRHPQRAFLSLKKITEKLCSVDFKHLEQKDFPEPMLNGYHKLYELMEYVIDSGEPHPIIIDADDLQKYPESILKQYCQTTGIHFSPSLLSWESGPEVMSTWITSKQVRGNNHLPDSGGFYSAAFNSTSFHSPNEMLDRSEVPKMLLPVIDESLPYYDKMYRLRIKP